jgi:DNA invertase Pin-like site-specific DNA recombinase
MNTQLTPERLCRRAVVYVRQSTPGQVLRHTESKRLQYGLAERARQLGFTEVRIIDDDLGRSADGKVDRPGFEHLVAEVCSGDVGAVFCLEASRLARNGRDWHHLIEMCGMTGAVLVDLEAVYDPAIVNDRLLLGLKGTMSEYELTLFRQRSLEARRQKASRGELKFRLAVGMCWHNDKIEKEPDQRVQRAIELVFKKVLELGSVHQAVIWLIRQDVTLPVRSYHAQNPVVIWKRPNYGMVWRMVTNPLYAGAYAYGRRGVRTQVVNGRARKSKGHVKPITEWSVLILDHHPSYVDWKQFEQIGSMLAANTYMKSNGEAKTGRGGHGLLAGMLRCRRCGHMLHVKYVGNNSTVPHYECNDTYIRLGEGRCVRVSGTWVDEAVGRELLQAINGHAVEAALAAAEQMEQRRKDQRKSLSLGVEQARYEARLAGRRYEAVDPDQRLVAAELEVRWNSAMQKVRDLEQSLQGFDLGIQNESLPSKELLLSLAQDLPSVWNSPSTDMRIKQRIARIVIEEIVADVDDRSREIVLLIHWAGGRHSELRLKKREVGRHGRCTSVEAVELVRQMAARFPDEQIAATLNLLEMRTGAGNTWDKSRVLSLRHHHHLPAFDPQRPRTTFSLKEAAQQLQISEGSVRQMIVEKILPAAQVVEYAPWEIPAEALDSESVRRTVLAIKNGRRPRRHAGEDQQSMF